MKIDVKDILKIELKKDELLVIEILDDMREDEFVRLKEIVEREFKRREFERPLIMISEANAKFTKIKKAPK